MREKMIPLVIMLTAGAATSIICIWKQFDTLYSLKVLLAVLVGFYLLGLLAKKLYGKVLMSDQPEEEETEQNPEEQQKEGIEA